MTGAERTLLSRTMAIRFPTFFSVIWREDLATSAGEIEADIGFVETAADPHLGVLDHVSGHEDLIFKEKGGDTLDLRLGINVFFKGNRGIAGQFILQGAVEFLQVFPILPLAGFFGLLNQLRQVEAGRFGHQLEFKLGGITQQFHGPFRIADSRQLDDDFIASLTDNDRLGHAELVDPVTDDLKRLVDCVGLDIVLFLLFQAEDDAGKAALFGLDFRVDIRKIFRYQFFHLVDTAGVGQGEYDGIS